ncbi:protein AGENET DOMAIN (AGD)-CONTAINING P1-like [Bidens hawaiensis]|uniref:protein AGENET DOMAIN (AGD)-CONTAINING P1-like n=1 Tax=Bidens hawaiensis TaxID=980011 RepID=UPI00404B5162
MKYKRGDQVEVADLGHGFLGSYYRGNIISTFENEYIVQFRTLLENDSPGPLWEFVKTEKIRPIPTSVEVSSFHLGEKVDVYANDSWWTGMVISKMGKSEYLVHFGSTNQHIMYLFPFLRVHQEWDASNDIWVYTLFRFMLSLSDL